MAKFPHPGCIFFYSAIASFTTPEIRKKRGEKSFYDSFSAEIQFRANKNLIKIRNKSSSGIVGEDIS